jgi:hypothetical protein
MKLFKISLEKDAKHWYGSFLNAMISSLHDFHSLNHSGGIFIQLRPLWKIDAKRNLKSSVMKP